MSDPSKKIYIHTVTGIARNFDSEGPKMKKSYDVSLVTFFGEIITRTLLK